MEADPDMPSEAVDLSTTQTLGSAGGAEEARSMESLLHWAIGA
jgi:hypothetical protein